MSDRERTGLLVVAAVGMVATVAAGAVLWQLVAATQPAAAPAPPIVDVVARWAFGIVRHVLAWL